MKFTNKHNLPGYLFEWLTMDEYDHDPDTISATGLMKPARATYLSKKYADQLEIDCVDLVASRYGTALHDSFEKMNLGEIQEKRYYANFMGKKISGKPDLVIDNKLHDFKSTSVWKYIKADFTDYIKQLSIYRWLMWKNDVHLHPVGQICFLFTDWSKGKGKHDPTYPQCRVAVVDINLWDYEDTEKFIAQRIIAISSLVDNALPDCTLDELWASEPQWAIKKTGNKRAIKLYKSESQAQNNLKPGQEIEYRAPKVKRCIYCSARPFCEQAKQLEKDGQIDE